MYRVILLAVWVMSHVTVCLAQYERRVATRDFYDYYNHANYDEALVPDYTLPDMMQCLDGQRVEDVSTWENIRRPELLELFTEYMYGRRPMPDSTFRFERKGDDYPICQGKAMRRNILLHLTANGPEVEVALVWPADSRGPRKTLLGLSFIPNDSIWHRYEEGRQPKGAEAWQTDMLLERGYALATFCYTDAEADKARDHFESSRLHHYFYRKGQQNPLPDEWGAVACWSWTASRALEALTATSSDVVQADNIALMGHSRLGKTALWAGATDTRFAAVVSVNSGCCGAALSRRCVGETIECVNEWSYHWFCGNFRQFSHREESMPFDQHELLALIAPRKLIVISGTEDLWADPKGEELACEAARPAYALYGKPEQLHYLLREGPHAVLKEDWSYILTHLW